MNRLTIRAKRIGNVVGWLLLISLGLWFYARQQRLGDAILTQGVEGKALVIDRWYVKGTNSYTLRFSFRRKTCEVTSCSPHRYIPGDSVVIRFDPHNPTDLVFIDAENSKTQTMTESRAN